MKEEANILREAIYKT